ncbi:YeeE/YedE family protein [Hoeflea sp. TYP-13]|uniref:YeeE/YedE family protein n=1 Tax=Hoeflea sp. TYP-13 TaxID=3230023 RepID=UPI0034C6CE0B
MTTEFTPYLSLAGGILIGISATLLMAFHGRIAGMTGILAGVLPPVSPDWAWRVAFLAGSILAPMFYLMAGGSIAFSVPVSATALTVGGLIVGVGVTFGSGCTSGHGVCGMARFSVRSIVATAVFMASTAATVFVVRHIVGGI